MKKLFFVLVGTFTTIAVARSTVWKGGTGPVRITAKKTVSHQEAKQKLVDLLIQKEKLQSLIKKTLTWLKKIESRKIVIGNPTFRLQNRLKIFKKFKHHLVKKIAHLMKQHPELMKYLPSDVGFLPITPFLPVKPLFPLVMPGPALKMP